MLKLNQRQPIRGYKKAKKLNITSSRFKEDEMSKHAIQAIQYVKIKDRPQFKLKDWYEQKFYRNDATKQLFNNCPDQIVRQNYDDLSVQDFIEKYQKKNLPVIIKDTTKDWYLNGKWTYQTFYDQFKQVRFKIGQDQDGHKLRVPFKYYLQYLVYNKDDSPLYLFQSSLESNPKTTKIINQYKVPKYFKDDLFKLAGQNRRPPYRWMLMGPQRSGTTIHIDPLNTSAWNTSLFGHKRWVLMDQNLPKSIVKGRKFRGKKYVDQAINYFTQILPQIIKQYGRQKLNIIQFIQGPGQTVFVPGGWWHAVINLDDTMAVTQNVMTHNNFDKVWRSTRRQRRKFSIHFLNKLKQNEPALYERAIKLNQQQNFIMGQRYQNQSVDLSYSESSSSSSSSSSQSSQSDSKSISSKQSSGKDKKTRNRRSSSYEIHSKSRSRNKKKSNSLSKKRKN